MSKGSVLTTLVAIAAFGLSGCTGFVADQIVKPQNSRVEDMFTGYHETLLTAGIEPVDYADTIVSEHIDERFNIPTLLLASSDDQLVPASETMKTAEGAEIISFVEVADAGDHIFFSGDLGARCREVMPWLGYTLSLELLRNPCRQLQTFQNIMEAHGPAKGAN